jgi:tripartite-type tricarboxylate transporter receptor subunit TctC
MAASVGCLAFAATVAAVDAVDAAPWPSRPIRLIVPFATGTWVDVASRLLGAKLADALGQSVIIDNRPGASGNLASELVASSAPDGYTLLNGGVFITVLPAINAPHAVDPEAFTPITRLTTAPMLIVAHPSLHVSKLADLIALARREPGQIAYATSGVGTTPHLAAMLLSQRAGIDLLHIPYANTNAALRDVVAGEVRVMFTFLGTADAFLRSGALVPLAVTSATRDAAWPEIATVAEQGFPGYEVTTWSGLLAPSGLPPEIVDRLYRECARILELPEVRKKLLAMGNDPVGSTPEQFAAQIKADRLRWKEIATRANIRAE